MNIGIIKFGIVLDKRLENKNASGYYEVMNLVRILGKEHKIFILSKHNYDEYRWDGKAKIDRIIAFNGPWGKRNTQLNMLLNYTLPSINIINELQVPWYYINSDVRYNINTPSELTHKPVKVIGLYEDESKNQIYGHIDKIWLYNKNFATHAPKTIFMGAAMNDTHAPRSKKLLKAYNWLKSTTEYQDLQVMGKWTKVENPFVVGSSNEKEILDWLSKVKYSINIAVNPMSTTQKLWEYYLRDVITFLYDYDMQYNNVEEGHFLRIKDEYDIEAKIKEIEGNEAFRQTLLSEQRARIKPEYITGDFILDFYNNLLKQ